MSSPCFNCSQNFSWNSTQPCTCSIPFYLDQPYEVSRSHPGGLSWKHSHAPSDPCDLMLFSSSTEQRLHVLRPLQLLPEPPSLREVQRRQPAERTPGIPQGRTCSTWTEHEGQILTHLRSHLRDPSNLRSCCSYRNLLLSIQGTPCPQKLSVLFTVKEREGIH